MFASGVLQKAKYLHTHPWSSDAAYGRALRRISGPDGKRKGTFPEELVSESTLGLTSQMKRSTCGWKERESSWRWEGTEVSKAEKRGQEDKQVRYENAETEPRVLYTNLKINK